MSTELALFVGSDKLEETGIERLVLFANRHQIEKTLREFKTDALNLDDNAYRLRHLALWLYDTNAAEQMGYKKDWSGLFEQFTGLDISNDTFYRMARWAEWESVMGTEETPARLSARDARTVCKYSKQYGAELVGEAHRNYARERDDASSRFSLDKTYDTNIKKFVQMRLSSLPTADPRRALLEEKPKPAPVKKDEPAKTAIANMLQIGTLYDDPLQRTDAETGPPDQPDEEFYAGDDEEEVSDPRTEVLDVEEDDTEDAETEVHVEHTRRTLAVVPPGYTRLCAIESAAVAWLASIEGANMTTIRMSATRTEALEALRTAVRE
jgi:hypothetical protein